MNYLKFGICRKKGKSFMGQNFNAFLAVVILAGTSTLLHTTAGAATADEIEGICNERYYSADPRTSVRRPQLSVQSNSRSASRLVRGIISEARQHKTSTPLQIPILDNIVSYRDNTVSHHIKQARPHERVALKRDKLLQIEAEPNRDAYPEADPNPVKVTAETPVSTFGADVDRASYTLVRRHLLERDVLPPADAVRTEEIVNAFRYSYDAPTDLNGRFKPSIAMFPAPWSPRKQLLRIGIKAAQPAPDKRPPANIVFLIDVSGSMSSRDKLPLAKASVCMLLHQLNPQDRVALVVYAGAAGTKLKPTPAHERAKVLAALDDLESGGSTAGGEGIRLAYSLAEKSFRKGGVNRIVLATDGDFNVGIHEPRRLRDFVSRKRKTGVFLTVLGFGLGNYRDTMMQTLAQAGNGMAAYIDNIKEARRVLVDDVLSSLVTVARDVKFQIEFNPERVAEYRLIGYETRLLKRTDFNNDRVDSGDIGAGHTVTALYELTLVGGDTLSYPLRYARKKTEGNVNAEFAFLRIRFKVRGEDRSKLIERTINESDVITEGVDVPTDARFAAAAAWFAEALRNSPHVPANWSDIRKFADAAIRAGDANERQEFLRLVKVAEEIAGRS